MPEDMSDRMPEDLPVRKYINAMVGIIRSEVIYIFFFLLFILYIYSDARQSIQTDLCATASNTLVKAIC
jgi:hypothetical protein